MSSQVHEKTELSLLTRDCRASGKRTRLSVVIVYPNTYSVGMDNLGFQGVYGMLASVPGVHCERAFFEPGREGVSLESRVPLRKFDVVAFSVSYENDAVNVLRILKASGIEPFATRRPGTAPFVMAGGVGAFINPEPMSVFMDAIFLGEADEAVEEMLAAFLVSRARGKEPLLEALASIPGVYVPLLHSPHMGVEGRAGERPAPRRRYVPDLSSTFCSSAVLSARSHFGGMFLVEVARGCSNKCKFCAVSAHYAPLRFVPGTALLERIDVAVKRAEETKGTLRLRGVRAVGLLGACVADHPGILELARSLLSRRLRISVSSLRADVGSSELVSLIAGSGTRTLTIAPETGRSGLRQVVGKELDEERLLETVAAAREAGVRTLKVYFMIGLPEESLEDVDAIAGLTQAISTEFGRGERSRSVALSVSPFVPKAGTAFQWFATEEEETLNLKLERLSQALKKLRGVRFRPPGVRISMLESAISRGSWRTGMALYNLVFEGDGAKKAWEKAGLTFENESSGPRAADSKFPWEHLYPTQKRST
jgi:radical SAM superfamily enzyme YgiQ (UPF0313 family)